MRRMQGRRRQGISWLWRAGLVLALVFAGLSVTRAVSVFFQARTAFRETASVDRAIAERKQEITDLENRVMKLKSGEGLEMEARGRLNLQKPDEHVVVIVDDDKQKATSSLDSSSSLWQKLKNIFGIGK